MCACVRACVCYVLRVLCAFCGFLFMWRPKCVCVCVCACGAPHPSVDVHLILQIIRCSERYYDPGKFHGRGEYGAHLTYKLF